MLMSREIKHAGAKNVYRSSRRLLSFLVRQLIPNFSAIRECGVSRPVSGQRSAYPGKRREQAGSAISGSDLRELQAVSCCQANRWIRSRRVKCAICIQHNSALVAPVTERVEGITERTPGCIHANSQAACRMPRDSEAGEPAHDA